MDEQHVSAWIADPSVESVRDALLRVMPGFPVEDVTVNDVLDSSNPRWHRGTAWVGTERVVKFAWSPDAAAGLDLERRVVLALSATPFQRWLPPIDMTSERPLLVITGRVDGQPCVHAVFGSDSTVMTEATDVARAMTDLHDPSVLAAVRETILDLPPPAPQAETAAIRARLHVFLDADRSEHVNRWCDWVDEVQTRVISDPVLLHGDLHGYNMLVREGRLRCVLDYEGVSVGDHHYDFRYLPGLERSIRFFVHVVEVYEHYSGRAIEPAPVLAWHIRTVLGDALWRSEAGVELPDGGTVPQWVDELGTRISALAAWRPFDVP
jgi:aminoglycoside phosphotransferase (APT) family kinase protein